MDPAATSGSPADPDGGAPSARAAWAVPVALAALCALAFVFARAIYAPCDDAYIYLVYVQSWLAGDGFTYNGMHVQGFTSVLWAALLALAGLLTTDLPRAAETLSVLSGFFAVVVTYAVGRRLGLDAARALVAPFLLVACWDFAFYMGNGLETVLYAALVLASLAFTLAPDPQATLRAPRLPVVLTLVILTRPEGVVVAGIVVASLALRARAWTAGALCLGKVALALLPVIVALRIYYGHWVPNTWFVKSNAGFANVSQGLVYLANFAQAYALLLIAFVAALAWRGRALGRAVLPFLAVIGALVLDGALRGGDNMVGFRAFVPVLPTLVVVIVWALRDLDLRLVAVGAAAVAAVGVATFASGRVMGSSWDVPVLAHAESWRRDFERRREIGETLDAVLPADALVATNVGGLIPFYSRRPTLDMLGLNNEHIAHRGHRDRSLAYGHQVGDGAYVLAQRPDVIIFGGAGTREPSQLVSDRQIAADPEFWRLYDPVRLPGGAVVFVRDAAAFYESPPTDSRPWGRSRSSFGPTGTTPVGLMVSWLW